MTKVCCVCRRIEQGRDWSPEPLIAADAPVSHGYCPACFAEAMTEISGLFAAHRPCGGEGADPFTLAEHWSPCA